ncbi:NRDE family protein [Streptomyces chartreusis]|uniref:NRDE family protein n=1 Tax=Streptomyces chartreusis TaxID=1969 RepID=UPI003821CBCD
MRRRPIPEFTLRARRNGTLCTVVVSLDPTAAVAAVRDEVTERLWIPPAQHWPKYPGLLGGQDLRAGGTWLAVAPSERLAAVLLKGPDLPHAQNRLRSRGDLPLRAAAAGEVLDMDFTRYAPFYLLLASFQTVRLMTWDGTGLRQNELPTGTHLITNSGWCRASEDVRGAFFQPLFQALPRPARLDPRSPQEYWSDWMPLITGANLPANDPRSIIIHEELADGRVFKSLCSSLIALTPDGMRYDFNTRPRDATAFRQITLPPDLSDAKPASAVGPPA